MKALIYTRPNELSYRDEPDPATAPDEALVRIAAAGICGSDMHGYHGHDPRRAPPLILGHEAAGECLTGTHAGLPVVLNPLVTCGVCGDCAEGRSNLCATRKLIGMNRPGAFAELIAIPERNLIPLPSGMNPVHAALTEPTATALHGLALAARVARRPLAESRALVIGSGSVGLASALLLTSYGCRELVLSETNPLRRRTATAAGIGRVYDPNNDGDLPEGAFGLVVDAVGAAPTRAAAMAAVRPGGIIVGIGLLDDEGGLDMRKLTLAEVSVLGSYTYTRADLRAAVAALHSGALGDLGWVETRALADGAGAFADLDQGSAAAAKIVLTPH